MPFPRGTGSQTSSWTRATHCPASAFTQRYEYGPVAALLQQDAFRHPHVSGSLRAYLKVSACSRLPGKASRRTLDSRLLCREMVICLATNKKQALHLDLFLSISFFSLESPSFLLCSLSVRRACRRGFICTAKAKPAPFPENTSLQCETSFCPCLRANLHPCGVCTLEMQHNVHVGKPLLLSGKTMASVSASLVLCTNANLFTREGVYAGRYVFLRLLICR
ncbi:hypothetical protein TGMAS_314267 [Toxoplasma gondii MAS]|uniref:Uncharacterized protein n=1 Tax=Toxoplasma gondii MAS TaxID=943118 RepID=A0A086QYL8_TOXGO|nr:hypothetical protein TGMAS_314267 [Toxoplasma gondii MAS]